MIIKFSLSKKMLWYFIIHSLISTMYMWFFVSHFGLPGFSWVLHIILLLTIHAVLFFLLVLGNAHAWWKIVMSLLLSLYWYYLLMLYVLNWFSQLNWGSNVLFDFMVHLPQQIYSIATTEDISLTFIIILLLCIWLILLLFSFKLVKYISEVIRQSPSIKKYVYYSLGLISFMSFYLSITYSRADPREWIFEPILSSFALNSSDFNNNRSKIQALKDKEIKRKLESELSDFKPQTNVILIIADALRADRLPIYGYDKPITPFLSELQDKPEFQKVGYFTSTCSESICGIYSTLSSRQYSNIGFDLYGLSDVLRSVGYKKYFIMSSNHNYNALNKLYGSDFDWYVDGNHFNEPFTLHDDEGVIDQLQVLPEFNGQPAFFYFHLMSSHSLGKNKPPFNLYKPFIEHVPGFVGKEVKEDLEQLSFQLSNAYDNGVYQLDDYIKRIFSLLEKKGYMDDSLVILTGDHGDGLGERGYFFHTYNLFHEDINIPLVWYTEKCKLANTRYGTQIDIAPSVLDCLDIPVPNTWQGESLLSNYRENRLTIHQTLREQKKIMVMLENKNHLYKLIANQHNDIIDGYQLFDYYQDKNEVNNIINEVESDVLETMKKTLLNHFQ